MMILREFITRAAWQVGFTEWVVKSRGKKESELNKWLKLLQLNWSLIQNKNYYASQLRKSKERQKKRLEAFEMSC